MRVRMKSPFLTAPTEFLNPSSSNKKGKRNQEELQEPEMKDMTVNKETGKPSKNHHTSDRFPIYSQKD